MMRTGVTHCPSFRALTCSSAIRERMRGLTMYQILLVGAGSALGGIARFLASQLISSVGRFPLATLAINLVGSFAFGLIAGILAKVGGAEWGRAVRLFAVVGICGGFTTFSTFSNETFTLLKSGQWGMAAVYALLSLIGGGVAVGFGYWVSK